MRILVFVCSILGGILSTPAQAEYPLFDSPENIALVREGASFIYNQEMDSATKYIDLLEQRLPEHPVIPLMRALNISWSVFPIKVGMPEFPEHERWLREGISAAEKLAEENDDNVEAIFFNMSCRGLLTEYYADDGNYVKALREARKVYSLMKLGFELKDEYPEFYLTTGLYNYFREKYPQRHPIYKPLLWIFRSGDIDLGLEQIQLATEEAVISKVEAHLYLSYIYLRYENMPEKAVIYLTDLVALYPGNDYFRAKLLECYMMKKDYAEAEPLAEQFLDSKKPYYRLLGQSMKGLLLEKWINEKYQAARFYNEAIETGKGLGKGSYYRGLAYMGLGRIDFRNGHLEAARDNFETAMAVNDNSMIEKEAKGYLKKL